MKNKEAVAIMQKFVNDYMDIIEKDDSLTPEQRKQKVDALEKAWQCILNR
jgi:hypothetical protein|tara:strand:+ start:234 stop:383 length:150 start_codon:yes stop_codon:yes gene_type:complete